MASSIHDFRRSKLFRAAIIVPTIIALIFSVFNLTAPNDPEKISSNFRLGIVNLDNSKSFPLVSTQAIKAISRSLPFRVGLFKDPEKATYEEGCLSVPNQFAEIDRPSKCEVEYLDYNGEKKLLRAEGLLATCIQHEMDHLEGVLFIDYLSKLKKSMIIKKLSKNKLDRIVV